MLAAFELFFNPEDLCGEVPERTVGLAWRAGVPFGSRGSNPAPLRQSEKEEVSGSVHSQ